MDYWSCPHGEVFRSFQSSEKGLSEEDAKRRLETHGQNDIPKRMERSLLHIIISQFSDYLSLALIAAATISYLTGGENEAFIIFAIVLANAAIGFVQEYKSEKALQKLCKYITYKAKVMRGGAVEEVDTRYIVPGDVVLVETGDRIPADLRLVEAEELQIDESLVTGEAYPVHKNTSQIKAQKVDPQDMKNVAFMGTLVVNGKGKGIVVSTGMKSTFGNVVGYLKSEEPETNYHRNIREFSGLLVKMILAGVVFLFVVNAFTGKTLFDSALFSIALAVGIIPEALPMIVTIGLSRGALRMSKKGVIVKKLAVIEDLGNIDVLCTDKTGTLTENRITLMGNVSMDGKYGMDLVKLASACTSVVEKSGRISGNPIDVAIVEYAEKHKLSGNYDVLEEIPFDYTRKRMSVVLMDGGRHLLVCKGAPESVMSVCTKMKTDKGVSVIDKAKVKGAFESLFSQGYNVIALATKLVDGKDDYRESDEHGLVLLGFLCFMDPPRLSAKPTIQSLEKLGVRIKVLTGDYPSITCKVAGDLGITADDVVIGRDIDKMDEVMLSKVVEQVNVFARLTPEHKVRIMSALKKNGHVVGFLGDGVNDAPVLRYSDVGISVDSGVDIAKEASDIILTKKNLESILDGVMEGRVTFSNTTKYVLNTVSANVGNMTTLAIISPVLGFLPMLPTQILLTNLLSDGPLLSISTDRVDKEDLKAPKHWNMDFITRFTVFFGGISSMFDFITIGLMLFLSGANIAMFRTGWFIESTLSEILVTFAIRTRKSFYKSRPGGILLLCSVVVALLVFLLPYSPLNSFFGFVPLGPTFLMAVAAVLITYFSVVEIAKHFFFRKYPT